MNADQQTFYDTYRSLTGLTEEQFNPVIADYFLETDDGAVINVRNTATAQKIGRALQAFTSPARMCSIGHQWVNADWIRFTPTNAARCIRSAGSPVSATRTNTHGPSPESRASPSGSRTSRATTSSRASSHSATFWAFSTCRSIRSSRSTVSG